MPGNPIDTADSRRPIPQHVAIIMDGNGRWANQRNLPRIAGHEAGTENIRRVTTRAAELGIRYLTLWAFSTENWRRPADEVEGIIRILAETLPTETEALNQHGARLHHIGTLEGLSAPIVAGIEHAMELTRNNSAITLTLAFNYGGRDEIVTAIRRIIADGVDAADVDEKLVERYLYTVNMPDPDLIIRTSGEMRTSNFMLWQSVYAEYHFTTKFWPEFTPGDLEVAIADYQSRERRFGGVLNSEPSNPTRR